ncbi:MAG: thioredoxin family protein [Myxococcota bacterium]
MVERFAKLFLFVGLMLAGPAHADGTASPAPPAPPEVNWDGLPASAVNRPMNQPDEPHQVEMRLITDKASARPGDTFRLGLWLEQDEGWHTYWKYNNDVGLPTNIEWVLPEGASHTDYVYPVPQRFDLMEIISYGYDDQVLFFTEVTVPADAKPGPITLAASADWLTCLVQCINGEGKVELPFEIVAGDNVEPTEFAPLFDHFAAQHPLPLKDASGYVRIDGRLEPAVGLTPDKPWKAIFTVTPEGGAQIGEHNPLGADSWPTVLPVSNKDALWLETVQIEKLDSGALQVTMNGDAFAVDNPETMPIGALFQLKVGEAAFATEATIDAEWFADAIAAAQTAATTESTDAETPEGYSALMDDPTCGVVKAGLGNDVVEKDDGGIAYLFLMLGMAFLGGLILNIMPCVLPVLALKVYGLVEQKSMTPKERISEGLAYTAGILVSFLALAMAVVALKVVWGLDAGWGFMFQQPTYMGAMTVLVFAFGLSMLGLFELPVIGGSMAGNAQNQSGLGGVFLTGVFATLLATPCTAPMLAPAMGFAFAQPLWIVVIFFLAVGLGLASPFLLISFVPPLYKLLPQPGEWMETFKQFVGLTLLVTTAWLLGTLADLVGYEALIGFLWFLSFVVVASWIFGKFGGLASTMVRQLSAAAVAAAVLVLGGWWVLDIPAFMGWIEVERNVADVEDTGHGIPWKAFNEQRMAQVLAGYREGQEDEAFAGKTLFIDFTAEWCLTCKANEKAYIDTQVVEDKFRENDIVALKGDWTKRDDNIASWLSCFETAGVPYYLVVPADRSKPAVLLGETLSGSAEITDAIDSAIGSES